MGLVLENKESFRDRKHFKSCMMKINRVKTADKPVKFFYNLKIWRIKMSLSNVIYWAYSMINCKSLKMHAVAKTLWARISSKFKSILLIKN